MNPAGFHIITGGPGSGKSTLLEALGSLGATCSPEVSRELIRQQAALEGGALPWTDLDAFSLLASAAIMQRHDEALSAPKPCFFDRGLPDVIGYLRHGRRPVPEAILKAHEQCRYSRDVFILPPWPDIYVNDAERPQSMREAEALHHALADTYLWLGYRLHEVPRLPAPARAEWVLGASPTPSLRG